MTITIPFTQTDRQFVERHQPSNEIKARYFAAQATHRYLQRIGIPSTVLENEADAGLLDIPEVGRLRSRPLPKLHPEIKEAQVKQLQPIEDVIDAIWDYVSPEGEAGFIGDIWIELDDNHRTGELLGFLPPPVDLRQWLEGIYHDSTWERPVQLIDTPFGGGVTSGSTAEQPVSPIYSQVNSVSRAKLLKLGQVSRRTVVLLVRITSKVVEEQEEFDVCLQLHVYKNGELTYLPKRLTFTVFDQAGEVLRHAQASRDETYLEYQLNNCKSFDEFSVKVTLGEESIIEKFVV